MISYRHHVVSLVAIFLALAVGVVLGGGPLSELGREESATAADTGPGEARTLAFAEEFAAASGPRLYADGLRGRNVALVTAPGVDEDALTALTAQVEAAGSTVAGRYDLSTELVSGSSKTLVDTLGSQLVEQVDRGLVGARATTYVRMGQLLGRAVATSSAAPERPGSDEETIRQSLVAADLVVAADEEAGLAPLVLLVLGEDAEPTVLAGLVSGLGTTASGVVVAGDSASGVDGDLAALREDAAAEQVTTVDGVDTMLGQVSAVLALISEIDGTGGSFGASGDAGPVPLG